MTILLHTFLKRLLNKTILMYKAVPSISPYQWGHSRALACDTSLPWSRTLLCLAPTATEVEAPPWKTLL